MANRIHRRRGNGEFRRSSLETDLGITAPICPHCRGFNPRGLNEPASKVCGQCGKPMANFNAMTKDIPMCLIGSSADDARTIDDLVHAARIQLDLIAEGQDGTEDDDPNEIRDWLKKWGFEP